MPRITACRRTGNAYFLWERAGFPLPRYPEATHEVNGDADAGSLFRRPTPTVWDALRDIPEADDYEELLHRDWVKAKFKKPTEYSAPLRGDEVDAADYSIPREFDSSLLTSSLRTVHTDLSKKRFLETRPGDTEPVSRFHKLDPKGVCNTIRAGTASDHGAFTSPRPIHPHSPRCYRARSGAPAFLSRLVPLSRNEMARFPADRQLGSATPRKGRGGEGPRSIPGPQKVRRSRGPGRLPHTVIQHVGRCRTLRRAARRRAEAYPHGAGGRSECLRNTTPRRRRSRTAIPPSSAPSLRITTGPARRNSSFRGTNSSKLRVRSRSRSRRIWATRSTPFGSEPFCRTRSSPPPERAASGLSNWWAAASIASGLRSWPTSYRTQA